MRVMVDEVVDCLVFVGDVCVGCVVGICFVGYWCVWCVGMVGGVLLVC